MNSSVLSELSLALLSTLTDEEFLALFEQLIAKGKGKKNASHYRH